MRESAAMPRRAADDAIVAAFIFYAHIYAVFTPFTMSRLCHCLFFFRFIFHIHCCCIFFFFRFSIFICHIDVCYERAYAIMRDLLFAR